jgi:predicted ArsR family transcriptional regulator
MKGVFMLEFLISSASRRRVLVYLLNNQDKELHLRELSRNIGEPAPIIKRELDRLEQIGFVLSWMAGNRRNFRVNKNFLLLPELKSLVDKSIGFSTNLKVVSTFVLKETFGKRKIWEERSKKIVKEYGGYIERQRPRHPAEARMLEKIS